MRRSSALFQVGGGRRQRIQSPDSHRQEPEARARGESWIDQESASSASALATRATCPTPTTTKRVSQSVDWNFNHPPAAKKKKEKEIAPWMRSQVRIVVVAVVCCPKQCVAESKPIWWDKDTKRVRVWLCLSRACHDKRYSLSVLLVLPLLIKPNDSWLKAGSIFV